jgi:hypothetical protein
VDTPDELIEHAQLVLERKQVVSEVVRGARELVHTKYSLLQERQRYSAVLRRVLSHDGHSVR